MSRDESLTVPEVATRLKISPLTVRQWLREGKLKGVRLGGPRIGWRVPASEMERVLHGEPLEGKSRAAV